jgi:hypothetical protein
MLLSSPSTSRKFAFAGAFLRCWSVGTVTSFDCRSQTHAAQDARPLIVRPSSSAHVNGRLRSELSPRAYLHEIHTLSQAIYQVVLDMQSEPATLPNAPHCSGPSLRQTRIRDVSRVPCSEPPRHRRSMPYGRCSGYGSTFITRQDRQLPSDRHMYSQFGWRIAS